ncbi:unnamed protein product [Rotaria socialis]|uniref:HAT C-terminal dimerisation domain-containing protein n=1 Tax=Rotaria socialis TaxID=392032 RepID=A0A821BUQ5_9BILA|nr:unnamed protein product [Rotaria socialis]CAF4547327.1 unnamed protein product [Rotaria socialis]CAF4596620.1 unnamed protein product [Rotaria socialis]CAF4903708.1 unnamed protein product [Rotaria socialis]
MSLSMFNHDCENVLQLIGGRVVSLRLIYRLRDDFFGCKVDQLLKNIQSSTEVGDLKKSFTSLIRSVISYIEKYDNNNASFYEAISIFNEINIERIEWKNIQHCTTYINNEMLDLDGLYNDFNNIKSKYIESKEKFGGINKQIESFLIKFSTHDFDFDDDERDARCHKNQKENHPVRVDLLWAYLIDGEDVPNLKKLVQFVFSIPASNAFCETIFSHMKYLWNDNRNRMSHDLVGAELKIKMNIHFTCAQFYDYL